MEQKDVTVPESITYRTDNQNQEEKTDQGVKEPICQQPENQQHSRKKGKIWLFIAIIFVVILLAAGFCLWFFVFRTPKAENIVLSETEISLFIAENTHVSYTVLPEKANQKEIEWASSDERIAKVDDNGTITAIGSGICSITASVDDQRAIVQVNVLQVNKKEYMILGKWPGKAGSINGNVMVLSDPLYLKDDLTGTLTIVDDTYDFTWKYDKTDEDGDLWFDVYFNGASNVMTLIYYVNKNQLMLVVDVSTSAALLYERS